MCTLDTSNGNSTFRIKTNYWKLFPLEKNTVLIFETRRSAKSSNGNEARNNSSAVADELFEYV